jgi:hypothetical protein
VSEAQHGDDASLDDGDWVVLQTSVRPSVRGLARSTIIGVTRVRGERYTLREFLTEAIVAHSRRLANELNGGKAWPDDDRPLPPGRTMS